MEILIHYFLICQLCIIYLILIHKKLLNTHFKDLCLKHNTNSQGLFVPITLAFEWSQLVIPT